MYKITRRVPASQGMRNGPESPILSMTSRISQGSTSSRVAGSETFPAKTLLVFGKPLQSLGFLSSPVARRPRPLLLRLQPCAHLWSMMAGQFFNVLRRRQNRPLTCKQLLDAICKGLELSGIQMLLAQRKVPEPARFSHFRGKPGIRESSVNAD